MARTIRLLLVDLMLFIFWRQASKNSLEAKIDQQFASAFILSDRRPTWPLTAEEVLFGWGKRQLNP